MLRTKTRSRVIALLLMLILALGMLPAGARAEDTATVDTPALTYLQVNGNPLPDFDNAVTSYTVNVNGVTTSTITANYNDERFTLTYSGTAYISGASITVETPATGITAIELTLTDKTDESLQTVYTLKLFNASSVGLGRFYVFPPDEWGDITDYASMQEYSTTSVNTFVNGKEEGTLFQADADGVAGTTTGFRATVNNYRVHFLTKTNGVKIMFSSITQPGYIRIISGETEIIGPTKFTQNMPAENIPIANAVTKLTIELCTDATYAANGDAFIAENSYNVFVDKLSVSDEEISKAKLPDMIVAGAYFMDQFTPDSYHATMSVAGKNSDKATYTFITADSDTKVYSHATTSNGALLTPTVVESGDEYYTFEDTIKTPTTPQSMTKLQRAFRTERVVGEHTFGYLYRIIYNTNVTSDSAFEVIDYIVPASQYTNKGNYGMFPERLYGKSVLSLGNFGGYITVEFTEAVKNDPKNLYGVDLYILGNSVSGGQGFGEPANVWVSNDKEKWYLLAGSNYFDDNTIRDYEVTYKKSSGYSIYSDNQGKTDIDNGTKYGYPLKQNYPLYKWADGEENSMTFAGPLLTSKSVDDYGSSSAAFPYWGYVDVNLTRDVTTAGSPYIERTEGFDIAWAIDTETGLPAGLESVKYVKISTASHIYAGAIGEKSTEVTEITRAVPDAGPVGKTDAPHAITVNKEAVALTDGTYVYNDVAVPKKGAFVVSVTAPGANVFINGFQGAEHTYDSFPISEVIRVVVQEGEKEPLIYYLNLKPDENEEELKSSTITFVAGGAGSAGKFDDDGKETKTLTYTEQSADKSFPTPTYNGRNFLGWYDEKGQKIEKWDDTLPAELTLTAKWEYVYDPQTPQTIRVTFRLIGSTLTDTVPSGTTLDPKKMVDDRYAVDLSEGDAGYHGAKYVTWIPTTTYTMKPGDTNYDLFIKALGSKFGHEGAGTNYVKAITPPASLGGYELREMTNGERSGWMYTVGKEADYSDSVHPGSGLKEWDLEDGDVVVWHYVNDYLYEVEDWDDEEYPAQGDETTWNRWLLASDEVGSTGSGKDSGTVLSPKVTASNGVAEFTMEKTDMDAIIADAKENDKSTVTITPEITGTAHKVSVELPKASVSSLGSETDAALKVETPVGSITIPNNVLSSVASQASGDTVTISLDAVDKSTLTETQKKSVGEDPVFDISIISGGKNISSFNGESITISLPYTLKDGQDPKNVTVWYLNDAGELEEVACTYDKATGMATFSTTHLSMYLVSYTEAEVWKNPFTDVKTGDWFYSAVEFVGKNNLFNGTTTTTFGPNTPMSRAMLATVLYRLEGLPAVTGTNRFNDVKNGEWYTDAVIWADMNGIIGGYDNGLFGTNDSVTREQMAAILYRYAKYKGYDVTKTVDLKAYTDADSISSYAQAAMIWANAEGLLTGRTTTTLVPGGSSSRAEVATILMRFAENVVK